MPGEHASHDARGERNGDLVSGGCAPRDATDFEWHDAVSAWSRQDRISWRLGWSADYKSYTAAMSECPFCTVAADAELIALATPRVLVFPALKQRRLNRGHMLITPRAHVTTLIDFDKALIEELYTVAAQVSAAVRDCFVASGATLFQGDEAPEQTLLHVHVHVVPRKADDNFRIPDPLIEELGRQARQLQALALRQTLSAKPPL